MWPLPQTVSGGRVSAPPPGRPGKLRVGCRAGGGGDECAARRSQELTLLAGGSCSRCTSGSGLRPCPRPPARPALPSRNAGSASRIWSAFLGAAGAPSGAPSGAWPGLEGGAPPGFPGSSLLWLPAAAPRQPHGWTTGPERAAGLGFLPVGLGDPRDQLLGPHCRQWETEAWRNLAPCPGFCSFPCGVGS